METGISDERIKLLEKSGMVSPKLMEREALPSVLKKFIETIKVKEGKGEKGRPGFLYRLAQEEKPTIGYGHQVVEGDREVFDKLFGNTIDFDALMSSKKALTDEQMNVLVKRDAKWKLEKTKEKFPKFNTYSERLKNTLVDSMYRGGLAGSPKTRRLINQGKFAEASKEFLDNNEYRQSKYGFGAKKDLPGIATRMEEHALIMLQENTKKTNSNKSPNIK